jgi:xylulokinase
MPQEYLLGFDVGSSSVKVTLLDANTGTTVSSANSPSTEMQIASPKPGWAEQDPEMWWTHAVVATKKALDSAKAAAESVIAIGISYQMHGLVIVDQDQHVLRPSIIWCDSRAVPIGDDAYAKLGERYCQDHLLNSPGNFTASKLKWVKTNEPDLYKKIFKIMLPGDYLGMRLTGEIFTTVSGLSEGIFWDYKNQTVAENLLAYYGIDQKFIPEIVPTFGDQGKLTQQAASILGLKAGVPVAYRAGDQPNNAFSLKTLDPGEIAATAGTSGVIYGVVGKPASDKYSRVNAFAHVNHKNDNQRLGILLCVNGTGIMNSWLRKNVQIKGEPISYDSLNELAERVSIGSENLVVLPFGNGAERVLKNKELGASFHNLDLNRHDASHLSRAVQEGIVFALGYGFEVMNDMGLQSKVIRAGKANMFLSKTFCEAFTNITGARIELFNTDGSAGAARGAGVGIGHYTFSSAFNGLSCIGEYAPEKEKQEKYKNAYEKWKTILSSQLTGR